MLTTSERTTAQHTLLTPHFVTSAYVLQHLDKQPAASPELENQSQQINILLALTRQYGCTVETLCEGECYNTEGLVTRYDVSGSTIW